MLFQLTLKNRDQAFLKNQKKTVAEVFLDAINGLGISVFSNTSNTQLLYIFE